MSTIICFIIVRLTVGSARPSLNDLTPHCLCKEEDYLGSFMENGTVFSNNITTILYFLDGLRLDLVFLIHYPKKLTYFFFVSKF